MLKRYFGEWSFYKKVLLISVPLALQQLLSSAMGIVDSIMVSWINEVTAVGTASQIEGMCITICFGAVTGIGIFAAQFYGAKEYNNMKKTFGIAMLFSIVCGLVWLFVVEFFGHEVVSFYIKDEAVVQSALRYLAIAKYSYVPLCLAFSFSYWFRCMHKTYIPMVIGISAMAINCCLNYCLIFGHFGMPELGVVGAAWGTLAAQYSSLLFYVVYSVYKKVPFIGSFQEMFGFDMEFVKPIWKRTYPLVMNEALFSFGSTLFIKAYGILGKAAMDSYYVGNQITNIFFAACNGISSAASAILGAELGKNKIERAIDYGQYFLGLAGVLSIVVSVIIIGASEPLVNLFGLQDPMVHKLAVSIVQVAAIRISLRLFNVVVFSALRAGGDSKFLMLLDSGIMWTIGIPFAYFLVVGCGLTNIAVVFLLVQLEQLVRIMIGLKRYHGNVWAKNLTIEVKA